MGKPSRYVPALLILLGASALAGYFYREELHTQMLAVTVLVREMLWRAALWTGGVVARITARYTFLVFGIPFLPLAWKFWIERKTKTLKQSTREHITTAGKRWSAVPLWLRVIICVLLAVGIYFLSLTWEYAILLVNLIPFRWDAARVGFGWLRRRATIVALRVITARGLSRVVPALLWALPSIIRERALPRYVRWRRKVWRYQIRRRRRREKAALYARLFRAATAPAE
ncbi:MAG: hypothetical protein AAB919_02445 [Patescibacteria group bacterium]